MLALTLLAMGMPVHFFSDVPAVLIRRARSGVDLFELVFANV